MPHAAQIMDEIVAHDPRSRNPFAPSERGASQMRGRGAALCPSGENRARRARWTWRRPEAAVATPGAGPTIRLES